MSLVELNKKDEESESLEAEMTAIFKKIPEDVKFITYKNLMMAINENRDDEPVKTKEVALKLRRLGFYTHRLHSGWGFDVDRELIEKLIVRYNA
ncbi:hypothetical protein ES705_17582 [subsurface metagenome]